MMKSYDGSSQGSFVKRVRAPTNVLGSNYWVIELLVYHKIDYIFCKFIKICFMIKGWKFWPKLCKKCENCH